MLYYYMINAYRRKIIMGDNMKADSDFYINVAGNTCQKIQLFFQSFCISDMVIDQVECEYFVNDCNLIDELMVGYQDMALLNSEIVRVFKSCENDTDVCLEQIIDSASVVL